MFPHLNRFCVAAAIVATFPAAAYAAASGHAPSRLEQMLSAAGFEAVPVNSPERQAEVATLPQNRLIQQPRGSSFTYVLADPKGCACLYMGDAADYQAYQQLAHEQRVAQLNADAADAYPLNWDLWGPYAGWGWNGPRFIHYGGGGHGAHFGGGGGHGGAPRGGSGHR